MTMKNIVNADAQPWASECLDVKKYKWRFNPVWQKMLYSSTDMATVVVKWLICLLSCTFWNTQREWHCIAWLCWCAVKNLLTHSTRDIKHCSIQSYPWPTRCLWCAEVLPTRPCWTQVLHVQGRDELCDQPSHTQCLPILPIRPLSSRRHVSWRSVVTLPFVPTGPHLALYSVCLSVLRYHLYTSLAWWQSLLCRRPSCMEQSTSGSSGSWQLVFI